MYVRCACSVHAVCAFGYGGGLSRDQVVMSKFKFQVSIARGAPLDHAPR